MQGHIDYRNDMSRVVCFAIEEDYIINVTFDDGTQRTIDLEPILIGPMFGPLRDHNLFKQVRLDRDFGSLEWPTGADIEPAVLYDWPDHVDAIVERRQQLFAVPT